MCGFCEDFTEVERVEPVTPLGRRCVGRRATGNDPVIRDNSLDNCGTAIRIAGSGAQVRGSRIGYVTSIGVVLDTTSSAADVRENHSSSANGVGITIGGAGHLVRRNLIHGNPFGGFTTTGTPTSVQLVENVVVGTAAASYSRASGTGWTLTKNAALNGASGFYLTAGSTHPIFCRKRRRMTAGDGGHPPASKTTLPHGDRPTI